MQSIASTAVPDIDLDPGFVSPRLWISPAVVAAMAALGGALDGRDQAPVLLVLAVVAGLPHGALDHDVARCVFSVRYGRWWVVPFLAGYLGLFGTVLLLWHFAPGAMLLLFLVLSVLHFGDQDAGGSIPWRMLRILAHGGAPIWVPALVHPHAVARVFTVLAGNQAGWVQTVIAQTTIWLWLGAAITTLVCYAESRQSDARRRGVDLLLVVVLFVAAQPLIAFALYFAVIHAPREFQTLSEQVGVNRNASLLQRALPLTAVGIVLGGVIFVAGRVYAVDDDLVRTSFMLLSALTVPHMWLGALLPRTQMQTSPA